MSTTSSRNAWRLLVAAVIAGASFWAAAEDTRVRRTVGAGPLYSLDTETLRNSLLRLFGEVNPPQPPAPIVACIAPHGGYGLSGKVAAHAFKHLKPRQYDRVILLGASNVAHFDGCSIAAVDAYVTPLGFVPLDGPAIQKVCRSSLINERGLRYGESARRVELHEKEVSIELVLPFLQERLLTFKLVPIVVGELRDPKGNRSEAKVDVVAKAIQEIMDDRTLLVVSTNLTRYGPEYNYVPFAENVAGNIETLDREAIEFVAQRRFQAFARYLEKTRNPINGAEALRVLMKLLPTSAQGELLAHDTSSRILGIDTNSVSFVSMVFYDRARTLAAQDGSDAQPNSEDQ